MKDYLYLIINLIVLLPPIALGFDKRVQYLKKLPTYYLPFLLTAVFFIVWDQLFTISGVWGFNEEYTLGINIGALPLEEILFFISIPYASVFIFEVVKEYFPKSSNDNKVCSFSVTVALFMVAYALYFRNQIYSVWVSTFAATLTIISFKKDFWYHFKITYLIHLLPFFMVNGILTALPIVTYNDSAFSGKRVFTIPLEDFIYAYVLLLMNILLIDYVTKRKRIYV
jgi:lycopene cyclase domain-containing protein